MKRRSTILAAVLVLAFVLVPAADAAVTMVWSRFQAVKAARLYVAGPQDSVPLPESQSAGTIVAEGYADTPVLAIVGSDGQTEAIVSVTDYDDNELFAIGASGEITSTGDPVFNGDVLITGTLEVDGETTLDADLTVNADTEVTGTLDVDGAAVFASTVEADELGVVDDFEVGGDSAFYGPVLMTDTLEVDGDAQIDGGISTTGLLTITADGLVIDAGGGRKLEFVPGSDPNFGVGTDNSFTGGAQGSSILGGRDNTTDSDYVVIGGGITNTISAGYASIAGGRENTASGGYGVVLGGYDNTASGLYSIAGGLGTTASLTQTLALGSNCDATALGAICLGHGPGGMFGNSTASGLYSIAIGGNAMGAAQADDANAIAIGPGTWASGASSIAFGDAAQATGDRSIAFGSNATASHQGSFVWGDSSGVSATSVATDTFNVLATGGAYFTFGAANGLNLIDGNLIVGDGTPDVTLDGEDAYVEGTLEVDGATRIDGSTALNGGTVEITGWIYDPAAGIAGALGIGDKLNVTDSIFDVGGDLVLGDSVLVTDTLTVEGSFFPTVAVSEVTTDTLAAAAQRGTWFHGSGANTTLTLPAAAAGLSYCFYNYDGNDLYIDVQTGDQVHVLTDAAGDRLSNTTAGDSICLLAINATYWIATQRTGTWADAN